MSKIAREMMAFCFTLVTALRSKQTRLIHLPYQIMDEHVCCWFWDGVKILRKDTQFYGICYSRNVKRNLGMALNNIFPKTRHHRRTHCLAYSARPFIISCGRDRNEFRLNELNCETISTQLQWIFDFYRSMHAKYSRITHKTVCIRQQLLERNFSNSLNWSGSLFYWKNLSR